MQILCIDTYIWNLEKKGTDEPICIRIKANMESKGIFTFQTRRTGETAVKFTDKNTLEGMHKEFHF